MKTIQIVNTVTIDVPDYGQHIDMARIQEMVKRSGSHFFDADTMRYFRSRVDSYCVAGVDGWYFVTSEQQSPDYSTGRHHPRLYTVRCLRLEGYDGKPEIRLYELGGFQQFTTLNKARTAARHAAKGSRVCPSCRLRLMFEADKTMCAECQERADRIGKAS